jgi:hypothetical protein
VTYTVPVVAARPPAAEVEIPAEDEAESVADEADVAGNPDGASGCDEHAAITSMRGPINGNKTFVRIM